MEHKEKVAQIRKDVKQFYKLQKPFRIFHGSTNSTRIQTFNKNETIDASFLDEVLEIDKKNLVAVVEPNVPMDKLVNETLKYGLVPAVVMEFPGITIGGGIAGVAGESSSFKHGVFGQICSEIEVITPDGALLTTSEKSNKDLYKMFGGTYGTLGVITKIKVKLVPTNRYVNLTYLPVKSFDDAVKIILDETKKDHDYVDGIMFSKDRGAIIVGNLSDKKIGKIRRYTRAIDNWYYLDVKKNLDKKVTQTVPIKDYLFRYDRGAFWMGQHAFNVMRIPFNWFTRLIHNRIMNTRKLYEVLQDSGVAQEFLIQDLGLPANNVAEFMSFMNKKTNIYPMWLCPLMPSNNVSEFQVNNMSTPMCINIGVWGGRISDRDEFIQLNRLLEKRLQQLNGKKWFYAHAYYTEKEFWEIYDKKKYDAVRKKYHAEHLPTIFDKVVVKETYPIRIHDGVRKAIFGKAKLKIGER